MSFSVNVFDLRAKAFKFKCGSYDVQSWENKAGSRTLMKTGRSLNLHLCLNVSSQITGNQLRPKQTSVGPTSYFCSSLSPRPALHPSHINTTALGRSNYSLCLKTRMKVLLSIWFRCHFLFLNHKYNQNIFLFAGLLATEERFSSDIRGREQENERDFFFLSSLSRTWFQ